MKFELIDHTADIGIRAYGRDEKELFANSAYGMFSLIAELDGVAESNSREVEITAADQEDLLAVWLNELLYLFEVEHIIFKGFEVLDLEERRLRAIVRGERVDLSRHRLKTQIKAATHHMLKVEKEDGYKAEVIFDV